MNLKKTPFDLCSLILIFGLIFLNSACDSDQGPPAFPDIDISQSTHGIVPMPDTVDDVFKIFDRYTKVMAPNGKAISDEAAAIAAETMAADLTGWRVFQWLRRSLLDD